MFGRRVELFRLFGFPIRIDASWLIIAVLITWSLAVGLFPAMYPDASTQVYWAMGLAGAMGLFASIIVHEFAHAMVARRHGMPMDGITLFIFGGVAEMRSIPPSAKAEFRVAIAGPIMSVVVSAVFGLLYWLAQAAALPFSVGAVFGYLAAINLILVAFNILPAFPLDGGRVLRSALWKWKNDVRRATRIASEVGSGFGAALVVLGVFAFLMGDFIGGIWWVLIGLFLRGAAKMSYQQLIVRRALEGEPVRRFMNTEMMTVPPDIDIQHVVDDYVYRHHHKMFPVTTNGTLYGCVSTRQIKDVPRHEWSRKTARDVMESCGPDNTISPDEDAVQALSKMSHSDASRLMVVEGERLVGLITLKDMLRFIATKVELGDGGAAPITESELQHVSPQ